MGITFFVNQFLLQWFFDPATALRDRLICSSFGEFFINSVLSCNPFASLLVYIFFLNLITHVFNNLKNLVPAQKVDTSLFSLQKVKNTFSISEMY
jgi:hypothetical protein